MTVNMAYANILNRMPNTSRPSPSSVNKAIALLTFTSVVYRAETVLLLAPLVIQGLWKRWVDIGTVIRTGLLSAILSIGEYLR